LNNNLIILEALSKFLGNYKKTSGDNYSFYCPNHCHSTKKKLEINIETHKYQCWVCGGRKDGFKGSNLYFLFKKLQVSDYEIEPIKHLLNKNKNHKSKITTDLISLPQEYKSLINNNSLAAKHAVNYLKKRKISLNDIKRYKIGVCEEGPYSNFIIIPSYDQKGTLNYFIGKSFLTGKYKNPPISRNIIPFELFVNWNLPIILCEGPFDHIILKRNSIPLLGKNLQSVLAKKIIESNIDVYVALDKDAIKDSIKISEYLISMGKKVFLVEFDRKDPGSYYSKELTPILNNAKELSYKNIINKKLCL